MLTSLKKCKFHFLYVDNLDLNKRAIHLGSKFVPKCTCLVQAMAFKVLCRKNSDLKIVIGIRNRKIFESHAWVCENDKIVFGDFEDNKTFTQLISI